METKLPDPFLEFGGKQISQPSEVNDPFSEFGGQLLQPDGDEMTSKVLAKSYYANYMDSPMYKNRLSNFGINAKPDTKPLLNANIMHENHRTSFALSKDQSNQRIDRGYRAIEGIPYKDDVPNINIDKSQIDDAKEFYNATLTPEQMLAHELSHVSRKLSPKEIAYINSLTKVNPADSGDHDNKPNEIKADLDALRYQMWKKGLYDTRKRNMTIDDYKKISQDKDIQQSLEFKRLNKVLNPEDLIKMNNTIASNGFNNTDLNNIA